MSKFFFIFDSNDSLCKKINSIEITSVSSPRKTFHGHYEIELYCMGRLPIRMTFNEHRSATEYKDLIDKEILERGDTF